MADRSIDSLDMLDAAAKLPEQIELAVATAGQAQGLPAHDAIENVVVLGMGGSGIAGDICAAIAGPFMPVPVVAQKGYAPPQFVNEGSLVFAVSCSDDEGTGPLSGEVEITLNGTRFSPSLVEITPGTKVRWVGDGLVAG